MFRNVWAWAGQFRKREVNSIPLTSTHHQIPMHLSDLFESMALWQDHIADVIARAAMLHHRAVQIRPFVNGNGRWARLRTDAWLLEAKGVVIRWPRDMVAVSPIRAEYIAALKKADEGDLEPLTALHHELSA